MARIDANDIDTASVDAALITTRSVRRRLDLSRDVAPQLICDCIDIAEQAPTGGNLPSRRWIVVRDQEVKDQLARLHHKVAGRALIEARERLAGTDSRQRARLVRSAAHLAEHLADVPSIVVPTIIGRYDGSGRPGPFDSVVQAVWSFCVALRARGLGTTWTTGVLAAEHELAQLLGIPPNMTPIALLPVAWTRGTDFSPTARRPSRDITYFDHFGRTFEHGPSGPARMADGAGAVMEIDIDAPVSTVWELVSDINLPARYSNEFLGADWAEGTSKAAVGATFIGHNYHPAIGEWDVPCYVDDYLDGVVFGWRTTDPETPGARWRFELEPIAQGVRLRYSMVIGPGPSGISGAITSMPDKEPRILARRVDEHRSNMEQVLHGIKEMAEGQRTLGTGRRPPSQWTS